MDVLVLTQKIPFPPDRGDRIRSHHLLRRIGERHRLWLLAVDDGPAEGRVAQALDQFCHRHVCVPSSPLRRISQATGCLFTGRPVTVGWHDHPRLRAALSAWTDEVEFDVAYVFGASMAPYWLIEHRRTGLPAVLDLVDVESERWGWYSRDNTLLRRFVFSRERTLLARFEREIAQRASRRLLVSEAEARIFADLVPEAPADVLRNGVDVEVFARPQIARRLDSPRLVFVGRMDDHANVDAVLWFAREILPRVRAHRPDVTLDIVGSRPVDRVLRLHDESTIRVTGQVEDVRPYLWQSSLGVVPLRIPQGTQNKVLEAMAASLPVVATPLATRGFTEHGIAMARDCLRIEAKAEQFAIAILEMIDDPAASMAQAVRARAYVEEHHNWDRSAADLHQYLEEAAAQPRIPWNASQNLEAAS